MAYPRHISASSDDMDYKPDFVVNSARTALTERRILAALCVSSAFFADLELL